MSNTLKRIIELVERKDIKISDHGYDELAEDDIFVRDVLLGIKEHIMRKRRHKKLVHEGQYVAEVEIELIDTDEGWSPYLCPLMMH